jgi:hypothetical protein
MARIDGIKKRLEQNNFDKQMIKEIIAGGNLVHVITQMEKLLEPDMYHDILDSCACRGSKNFIKQFEKIGKEIADWTLSEKIDHVNSISSESEKIVLNEDGTLTVRWSFENGEKYKCICGAAVKTGVRVAQLADGNGEDAMPLSYCYCCAGSGRRHLQLQLGVELKTKEIISTPINSKGEKQCEFIFEIVK